MLACNVQFGGESQPLPPSSIMFIAPANNAVIAEGAEVTFAVAANDPDAGVARIEFTLNGEPLTTIEPPEPQKAVTARVIWTAKGVQGHFITAAALRADGSLIGEAGLTLTVVSAGGTLVAGRTAATLTATETETPQLPAGSPATAASVEATPTENARTMIAIIETSAAAQAAAPTASPTVFSVPPAPQTTIQIITTPVGQNPPTMSVQPGQSPTQPPTVETPTVFLTVTFDFLNIRAEPRAEAQKIGEMKKGDQARVIGRNEDRSWVAIEWTNVRGWVTSNPNYSRIEGDPTNLPLMTSNLAPTQPVPATPTPQPGVVPVSTVGNAADLVIKSVLMTPPNPRVGQTFSLTIVIENRGALDAGSSLIRGIFQPGDEVSDMAVPPLKSGQLATLPPLFVTLKSGGSNQTGVLIVDFNNEVAEGSVGEANNRTTVTYNVLQ